jgi:hypothetical protein
MLRAVDGVIQHRSLAHLEAALDQVRRSPLDGGIVELLVRRPEIEEREVLDEAELHPDHGMVGDLWRRRPPHTGCSKFVARFGVDAQKFVNSPTGRRLRLRGANARVITAGTVRRGDTVSKLAT